MYWTKDVGHKQYKLFDAKMSQEYARWANYVLKIASLGSAWNSAYYARNYAPKIKMMLKNWLFFIRVAILQFPDWGFWYEMQ